MAGIKPYNLTRELFISVLADSLKFASDLCVQKGIKVMIEPINPHDIPNYGIKILMKQKKSTS